MSKLNRFRGFAASGWVALAFAAAVPVNAWAQIEEVVVTTRKREENLQDIPIAVSAITSEQIQRQGISDLQGIVQNEPSVQFDQAFGPSDNRITIRGLSNTRGRSNVAFLVDGIDVTTENLISAGSGLLANRRLLTDVERIEVVKGPQNALFGRAAFAGAIAYVTKDPGDEFNGRVSMDVGQYGQYSLDAGFGGPLSDTFGIRISGVTYQEDGYYTNSLLGTDVGGNDGYGGALTAVWQPVDAVRIRGRVEYSEENYDPRAVANVGGDHPFFLPDAAKTIVRPVTVGGTALSGASSATNLFNFGNYCPRLYGFDPSSTPGDGSNAAFCLPRKIKSKDGLVIAQSENPVTGEAYPGTETETFGASLQASFDLGYGLITSYTGWINFNSTDQFDQDYQASVATDFNGNGQRAYGTDNPQGGRTDTLMSAQESNQDSQTDVFSQELRYATQWDGPINLVGGVLYWQDHRVLQDRNWITSCAPYGRVNATPLLADPDDPNSVVTFNGIPQTDPTTGTLIQVPGICDGANGTNGRATLTSWQQFRRQFESPNYATPWDARTNSWSYYGQLLWELTDTLTLTLEDRFVREDFALTKPGNSSCTEIAFATGAAATSTWNQENPAYCDAQRIIDNIPPLPIDAATGYLGWRYIEGTVSSSFNTPKLTLQWIAADGLNFYFSYAFAEKPGGINQLAGGGGSAPPTVDQERFDPEKLKAWEVGVKSNFEAAGFWQVNSSLFLQDYTDKQVGIQIVSENGVSQPAVVNASGAQVWGLEIEALWQPEFMEGLSLSISGTILDPEYDDWVDDTRNLVKAAVYGDCPVIYKGTAGGQELESGSPEELLALGVTSPVAFCRLDYSGNQLERTPKQSWVAAINIQRPFLDTGFDYLVELNGSWQDDRWADPENLVELSSYALVDLRLGITSPRWDVIAYLDNAFDDDTIKTAGSGPDFGEQVSNLGFTAGFGTTHYFATLPDPRTFGVRASYRFGSSAE